MSQTDQHFWSVADRLVNGTEVVVERPKGSAHPRYPEFVYPLDYGYLKSTRGSDGGEVDVWIGTAPDRRVTGALLTADLSKGDAEAKLLLGCTPQEASIAHAFHQGDFTGAILVLREEQEPY